MLALWPNIFVEHKNLSHWLKAKLKTAITF
jgi:hypothetical protein